MKRESSRKGFEGVHISSFTHASQMRFYFETEHPTRRKTSDPGIHGPIFHGFRIGPHSQFFDGANLNSYRSKSGPSNVGPKTGFLKSKPRTKILTGFSDFVNLFQNQLWKRSTMIWIRWR